MIKHQPSLASVPASVVSASAFEGDEYITADQTRRAGLVRNTALILLVINLAAVPLIWFSGSNLAIIAMLLVSAAILATSLGLLCWGKCRCQSVLMPGRLGTHDRHCAARRPAVCWR
jgi:hypothetical protein